MNGYRRISVDLVVGIFAGNGDGGDAPSVLKFCSERRTRRSRLHDYWISPPAAHHVESLFDAYGVLTLAKVEENEFGGIYGGIGKIHIVIQLLNSAC
jgi:hypothetical protein